MNKNDIYITKDYHFDCMKKLLFKIIKIKEKIITGEYFCTKCNFKHIDNVDKNFIKKNFKKIITNIETSN